MRFLFRLSSFLLLVGAVFGATLDTITSVADSRVTLTSIGAAWTTLDRPSLLHLEARLASQGLPLRVVEGVEWLLQQPAFAVALALSLLFWIAGFKKAPAAGRFAA